MSPAISLDSTTHAISANTNNAREPAVTGTICPVGSITRPTKTVPSGADDFSVTVDVSGVV